MLPARFVLSLSPRVGLARGRLGTLLVSSCLATLLLSSCESAPFLPPEDEGTAPSDGVGGDGDADDGESDPTALALPSPDLPDELLAYTTPLPDLFLSESVQRFDNTPADNELTDEGATLGRVLFYDRRLSANGEVSCGSCHQQGLGFTDARVKSEGFDGGDTRRHSMPLINLRFYARGAMFWDERAQTLEEQVLMPIQDEVEMGLTLDELVERVASAAYYPPLFEAAFGDPEVTDERISFALAQFVRSIVSYRSKWDDGVALVDGDIARPFPNFSGQENRGKEIFFGQHDGSTRGLCGTCHLMQNPLAFRPGDVPGGPPAPPGGLPEFDNTSVFFMFAPANNGLFDDGDDGFGEVTGRPGDNGKFKSSTLRNIELTAPYMHDGRFETLEEVVAHYNEGVEPHPNLDPALREALPGLNLPIRLHLTPGDQAALVAFLRTLTDDTLADDERWSDPFPVE